MECFELLKKIKENKKYSLEELEILYNITSESQLEFYKALFELEKEGIIFVDEYNLYCKVPKDFCYYHGIIRLSKQNNYYVSLKDKKRILIDKKDLKNAKIGDAVFVEIKQNEKKKHQKSLKGSVVRVASLPQKNTIKSYYLKKEIKYNPKNDTYFIVHNNQEIKISHGYLNGAYDKDVVTIKITFKNNELCACVEEVLKRKKDEHVFVNQNGKWIPIGTEYFPVELEESESKYKNTTKILAKIKERQPNGAYKIEIIKILEEKSKHGQIELLALEKGFAIEFQEEVLKETKILVPNIHITPQRRDLRNLMTFTIDPKTAKDLDDAISLEKRDSSYRLYVHVADVDYYVKYNTELYKEAIRRGTSVYLGNTVIPQFPKKLSEQLCSLNPKEDKMTKTILMDFDLNGDLINFDIFHSVIKSSKKMDYDSVNQVLSGEEKIEYIPYEKNLKEMNELSQILTRKREERGSITINNDEMQMEYNENGKLTSIKNGSRGPAQIMIENFMLKANETSAIYAHWLNIPFIYRNHPCPTKIDEIKLNQRLKEIQIFKRINNIYNLTYFQNYIKKLYKSKTKAEIKCLNELFLRALPRAYYGDVNEGHCALALECYGTITSPIRKGSDFINHYVLGSTLNGNINSKELEAIKENLKKLCQHFTERQKLAEELEQEVDGLLIKEYISSYNINTVSARIACFMNDCIYVYINEEIIGILPLDKRYKIDFTQNILKDNYGNIYHIGDEIILNVSIANINHNKILLKPNMKEDILKRKKEF